MELIGGAERPGVVDVRQLALRAVGVGAGERRTHILQADAVAAELSGIEVHPHRRQRAAADGHLADAFELRQLLLQDGRGHVIHPRPLHQRGGERQEHDGRVRRIDLAIGRIVRQVCRKLAAGSVDRRLDVARRGVDVAVEVELQGDVGRAERARGSHLGDAGDASELPLQRRRHRRGHRLRACARQPRLHGDGGKLHLRQRRNGEELVGQGAGQRDRHRQQRGGNRPVDERRRNAHACSASGRSGRSGLADWRSAFLCVTRCARRSKKR